jgi:hypothetical protein
MVTEPVGSPVGNAFRELFRDERFGSESGDPADRGRAEQLMEQRKRLKERRRRLIHLRGTALLCAGPLLLLAPLTFYVASSVELAVLVGGYGVVFLLATVALRQRIREVGDEILEIDNEIDLLRITDDSPERRAHKLFQLHAIELKRYYDQTLHQGSYIFWVGLLCILLGFGVVGATVLMLRSQESAELSQQIVIAVLGAIGGILANFIAIIYLRMYTETVRSMAAFHSKLVGTHHLHFGNLLVAKISDDSLRESTLKAMCETLVSAGLPATLIAENGHEPTPPA